MIGVRDGARIKSLAVGSREVRGKVASTADMLRGSLLCDMVVPQDMSQIVCAR